jgi:hypothetical protein
LRPDLRAFVGIGAANRDRFEASRLDNLALVLDSIPVADRWLCNLWLTLLRGVGIPIESHGDSTGTIEQLYG